MRRIQYHQYGCPDVMRLEAYRLSSPSRNEIPARAKAASTNPLDWKLHQGFMKLVMGGHFRRAMGGYFSGVVAAIGTGITGFATPDH